MAACQRSGCAALAAAPPLVRTATRGPVWGDSRAMPCTRMQLWRDFRMNRGTQRSRCRGCLRVLQPLCCIEQLGAWAYVQPHAVSQKLLWCADGALLRTGRRDDMGGRMHAAVCGVQYLPLLDQRGAAVQDFCLQGSPSEVLPGCATLGTGATTSSACTLLSSVWPTPVDMTAT